MGKKVLSFLLVTVLLLGLLPTVALAEPEHVHTFVFVEEKAPTCTEEGILAHYHCEGCGKNFEDPEGERELESTVLPALGHLWEEPVYTWAEDHSTCTGQRVCRNDATHVETETAPAVGEQTREPAVGVPGEITYRAEFEAPWLEPQSLTAEGTLKPYFTLTYETAGGSALPAELYPEGAEIPLDRAPVRLGHTFGGWYLEKELVTRAESLTLTENRTVYAAWELTPIPQMLESETHSAYMKGYENNRFLPMNPITRGETATMFFRLLTREERDRNLTAGCDFTDVAPGSWYRVQVATIARMGLLVGRGYGKFAPEQPITRGEFITLCVRFAEKEPGGAQPVFTDIEGHWAEKMIRRGAALGWIGGYGDGSFHPNSRISRAEAVAIVNRILRRTPQSREDLLPGMTAWSDCRPEQWFYLDVQEASNGHSYERKEETGEKWTRLEETVQWTAWANYSPLNCLDLGRGEPYVYAADFARAMGLGVEQNRPLVLGTRDRVRFSDGKITVNGRETVLPHPVFYDADGKALVPLRTTADAMLCRTEVRQDRGELHILGQVPKIEVRKNVNVPVLMYHAVSDNLWGIGELFVSPSNMEKQLAYLVKNGYDPIWFEDLAHLEDYDKPVILTFDDGYDDNYTELFPLLKKYQVKATIFIIGNALGRLHKMNAAQIREMSDSGLVSIQSHGYTHNNMDAMSEATLEYELSETKKIITKVTGRVPYVLCYPSGKFNNLTLQVARRHYQFGIKMNGGLYNTSHDPYLVNRYYISRYTDLYTFGAFVSPAGT